MRQYTTPDQTAKLIELGFEKPKNERWVLDVANESTPSIQNIVKLQDYSIGELIEMLPNTMDINETIYSKVIDKNDVFYYSWELQTYALLICDVSMELIDNLYDMVIHLKEEGVI